jgi:hypothetical protein
MLNPTGFWSYHRSEGQRSHGWLAALHAELVAELENRIGSRHGVFVFRDQENLRTGAAWEAEINAAIDDASFLVPIVSPGFLQSPWCCHEVTRFLQREVAINRGKLIFPLHYIDVEAFRGPRRGWRR